MTTERLKDRIALVTGASRGIGRAVAFTFAREGAHVLLVARARKALEEVDDAIRESGGKATLIPLNLTDGRRVDALGPTLYERFGRLDVLVGNAAILGHLSPLTHIQSEHWERVIATNVTANWRLIRTLDPLLRRSDAGRVIFVTSSVAKTARAYWSHYSVSKVALENGDAHACRGLSRGGPSDFANGGAGVGGLCRARFAVLHEERRDR